MVTSTYGYVGLVAVIAAERLVEMAISRRNARAAFARGGFEVGRGHFPVMVIVHTLFLVACVSEVVLLDRPVAEAVAVLALIALAFSQALRYWAIVTLGDRWNVRVIVVPNEAPITSGPYRYLRHPNYVAVSIEMLALPLAHGAWVTAIVFSVVNALLLSVRIQAEEGALGSAYALALGTRPRFLPKRT